MDEHAIEPAEDEIEPLPACDECGEESEDLNHYVITTQHYPRREHSMALCESCADETAVCDDCGRRERNSDGMNSYFGETVCERCSENYYTCDTCGCDLHAEDTHSPEGGDGIYCADCCPSDDEDTEDSHIHEYNYKPTPQFFGTGKMFFGCELEVNYEDISEAVDWVIDNLGDKQVYLKEDGSLTKGFEIVSHPHSFPEAIALWSKMTGDAPMTSHGSGECGFHIHVSRAALTRLQIQKMIVFVNAPENAALVDKIAQRTANGYCRKKQAKIGHCGHSESRYEAINLENRATVEFRIFRGNTRPERLLKNLEFVQALIYWVNTVSYRELTSVNFAAYVAKNKKQYKHLAAFIKAEDKQENS